MLPRKSDAKTFLNMIPPCPKHCLYYKSMASTFPQKSNQNHPSKQIKKRYPCLRSCPIALGIIMHWFCECRPSLTILILAIHYSNKVMDCTHNIKSKKEYEFLKQKNNWNGVFFSFFCFKNPHPFRKPPSSKSTSLPSKNFRLYNDNWLMNQNKK